jgi:hypothetical protein
LGFWFENKPSGNPEFFSVFVGLEVEWSALKFTVCTCDTLRRPSPFRRARNFARAWGFAQFAMAVPNLIGIPVTGKQI